MRAMLDDAFWDHDVEGLPRSRLEGLQVERLRWQIARCYEQSPFYREKFEVAGVTPRHLERLSDIARFPFVAKQEFRDEQATHPPFGRYVLAPRVAWRELHPLTRRGLVLCLSEARGCALRRGRWRRT